MLHAESWGSPGWLRVLLVDGDDNDRALFGVAVERSDLDVWLSTLGDADEAVKYLHGHERYADRALHPLPELIVLGLRLPTMSGLEFLEWRRSSPVAREIPVAIFSGFPHPRDLEVARSLGAELCLAKPLAFGEFVEAVCQLLQFGLEKRRQPC